MHSSDEEYFRSCVAKERHLAQLLGHHNIEECYESAGTLWDHTQALPQWTRDWRACGPLMTQYGLTLVYNQEPGQSDTSSVTIGAMTEHFSAHPDRDCAVRVAIVKAVIGLLEHRHAGT